MKRKFRNARPGRIAGPGRAGPDAGPVIRRAEFFRNFFSRPGPVLWFFLIEIKTFWPKIFFSSFFILIHPEPPPKPSYVPKKHPQKKKKNHDFFQKIRFFDKILYKPLFGPIGTWFWSSRMIENGFLIQMVPLWCPYLKINDVSWQNNVWHKFFLYKPCSGPYGTWFWSSRSIENWFLILFI